LFTAEAPELALRLLSALGRRVCELVADIKAYSLHSGRERVADYLLQLAALNGASVTALTLPPRKASSHRALISRRNTFRACCMN
jgi:hypothetical protein